MIERVLIANRGEIAVRIIRACRKLGLETVAVYSQADKDALHVRLADVAMCIGPPPSRDSYLKVATIMTVAHLTGADAIHPGYGFLSEDARFAKVCREHGLIFVGPPADAIRQMGDKSRARETMRRAGVPVVPGSEGTVSDFEAAVRLADEIGYPVMVKAAAGGGGRGMRIAQDRTDLARALNVAQAEASAAFGNGAVYVEKFVARARHVEVQVLADAHGRTVHLGERDCSIQRRHQKLIEESPSPAVNPDLRARMGRIAVLAVQAMGYTNVGTVEFLLGPDGCFYFMEMNTRIQVEHPVTEMVTGVDIVEQQIRIARDEPLPFLQEDIAFHGHAIECRINAEDPDRNFSPCPGRISAYTPPSGNGVRVDTHVYEGYTVPHHYDSLLAKVIAHAATREAALDKMVRSLRELRFEGVRTTIPFLARLLQHERFRAGDVHTKFVEQEFLSGAGASGDAGRSEV
jgi:acetyl-CoA carboxylase biotin carboxylase subunit